MSANIFWMGVCIMHRLQILSSLFIESTDESVSGLFSWSSGSHVHSFLNFSNWSNAPFPRPFTFPRNYARFVITSTGFSTSVCIFLRLSNAFSFDFSPFLFFFFFFLGFLSTFLVVSDSKESAESENSETFSLTAWLSGVFFITSVWSLSGQGRGDIFSSVGYFVILGGTGLSATSGISATSSSMSW